VSLRAPKTAVKLSLRVVRAASPTTKAIVGATLHVRVVKTSFKVTAAAKPATTAVPLAVTGTVTPKASGSVSLDQAVGTQWVSIGKAVLSGTSSYAFSKALAVGTYKLRVSKAFSTTVAAGVSASFTSVVSTAVVLPADPVVTATTLSAMVVGRPATTTLTASLGKAPYTWSVASGLLPAGLSLVPSGVVSGRPTVLGTTSFVVRVTDAAGHSGTGTVTATVATVALRDWGGNAFSELGVSSTDPFTTIQTPVPASSFTEVTGGDGFALALRADGTVWAWGKNDVGQLAQRDIAPRTAPSPIPNLSGVVAIAAGESSGYAVKADGTLWSWGGNVSGELGIGSANGTPVVAVGRVPSLDNVIAVSAGHDYAMALTGTGQVYTWGNGFYGVLGNNTTTAAQTSPVQVTGIFGVTAISAGDYAGYALLRDGTVRSWGFKEHGQLGSTAFSDMGPYQLTPVTVSGLTDITAINGQGFEAGFALHADGTVSAWGNGTQGEMGNGTTDDNSMPAVVPGLAHVTELASAQQTAYALRADGTVASWGYDLNNELGTGSSTTTSTSTPAAVPGLSHVVAVGAGSRDAYIVAIG
jgi:alpha-tubulin suppressor-like RCC1 family protein